MLKGPSLERKKGVWEKELRVRVCVCDANKRLIGYRLCPLIIIAYVNLRASPATILSRGTGTC